MMHIGEIIPRFEGVKKNINGFQAMCPGHDDKCQSLSISEDSGRILLHCHAGCDTSTILERIGLSWNDLDANVPTNRNGNSQIKTEYIYTDKDGKPLYKVIRKAQKSFYQMRYENGDWVVGTNGVQRVPYRLPELLNAIQKGETIYIAEGEKDVDNLFEKGLTATTNVGGAGKWRDEYNESFRGASVTILPDNDVPGRKHGEYIASSLVGIATCIKVVHLDVKEKQDVTDWLEQGHTVDEIKRVVHTTPEWSHNDKIKWDENIKQKKKQGPPFGSDDPEPSMNPVNATELFYEMYETIGRFVFCGEAERVALILFILHTHVFEVSECTPILGITSPEKRCGKTTLISLLKVLCPRAVSTSNITAATLFRIIDAMKPTILIDEADTFAKEKIELRGVINAGHSRSDAHIFRCDGNDFKPRAFNVFCPKAIAMIGTLRELGDTVQDRSIEIRLQRAGTEERREKFRRKQRESLKPLHSRIARWAMDSVGLLKDIEPDIPGELNDRAADGWEPLLAIADLLGESIPLIARQAALKLSNFEDVHSIGTELLKDIKIIFGERNIDEVVPTFELLESLHSLEESPWKEYTRGKELSASDLAKLLRPFGIKPILKRFGEKINRGYRVNDFVKVFQRYLHPTATVTPVTDDKKQ
jgi:hypothetical protein